MIIDTHCHVYPKLSELTTQTIEHLNFPLPAKELTQSVTYLENIIQKVKPYYKNIASPYLKQIHDWQVHSRNLPNIALPIADKLIGLLGSANTLIENNIEDLLIQTENLNINYTVLIAHPPFIPNEFILNLANNHKQFIPFVNIPYELEGGADLLEKYIHLGAKGIKIHAASDGGETTNPHYLNLLEVANKHQLPVIIHTGCIHIQPLYKIPHMGHAEHFQTWIQDFPKINFILAHMNYHYPEQVLDIMNNYENVYTDTSWQPKSIILKAVNQVGHERIMFGTDWPLIGDNISIALDRIRKCHSEGKLNAIQSEAILGRNASRLFSL